MFEVFLGPSSLVWLLALRICLCYICGFNFKLNLFTTLVGISSHTSHKHCLNVTHRDCIFMWIDIHQFLDPYCIWYTIWLYIWFNFIKGQVLLVHSMGFENIFWYVMTGENGFWCLNFFEKFNLFLLFWASRLNNNIVRLNRIKKSHLIPIFKASIVPFPYPPVSTQNLELFE
jgi:hypothetical protein